MSENNDILEYIVQCLLTNKTTDTNIQNPLAKLRKMSIDKTNYCILKRNLDYLVQQEIIQDNLENIYKQFYVEENNLSLNF